MRIKCAYKMLFSFAFAAFFTLLFSKSAVNMTFHEVGGLFAAAFLVLHVILNWKWVQLNTIRLFSKGYPIGKKINYLVDLLLIISVGLVTVSGIFMSEVLFRSAARTGGEWRSIHYFFSAGALTLCGIHIGINWNSVIAKVKNWPLISKLSDNKRRILPMAVLILFVGIGAYNLVSSDFTKWISAPFFTLEAQDGAPRGLQPRFYEGANRNSLPADASEAPGGEARGFGGAPGGNRKGFGKEGRGQSGGFLPVLFQYGSILTVFAAAAYYIVKILVKKQESFAQIDPFSGRDSESRPASEGEPREPSENNL